MCSFCQGGHIISCVKYEDFIKKLGLNIKKIRESQGLTQEDMDEGEFAVSYRTVQDIESGRSHASVRSLFKIAERLNVKVTELFDFEN